MRGGIETFVHVGRWFVTRIDRAYDNQRIVSVLVNGRLVTILGILDDFWWLIRAFGWRLPNTTLGPGIIGHGRDKDEGCNQQSWFHCVILSDRRFSGRPISRLKQEHKKTYLALAEIADNAQSLSFVLSGIL